MNVSDENNPNIIKPANFPVEGLEMGSRKFGQDIRHNRRALSMLSQNVVGAEGCPRVVNKRAFSEKFAAQFPKEIKKQKQSAPSSNAFGDCIFIDVEDNKEPTDCSEPMFLEHTEASPREVDQMEEIEMEDIIEEPILDIDGCDGKNPLSVVDYVEDLYAHYRRIENFSCVPPTYMAQQFDINEKMRAILIDWLIEAVVRKKVQLVGLVAMLLACKYEEVSVPVVEDLILIADKAYTREEVLEMENLILNKLQFNMSLPTQYVFMQRFLKAAHSDKKLEQMSFFFIELSLVEYEMLKFPPSLLAASAIFTAQCTLYGFKQWSRTCEWHTKYSEEQLLECSRLMVGFHQKAATGKLTGVYRKYNTSKFGHASRLEPAAFLLETKV